MDKKTNSGTWVAFSSKAPDHILRIVKEHCQVTGVKLQNFIAVAIEEKLERSKPKQDDGVTDYEDVTSKPYFPKTRTTKPKNK